MSGITGFIDHNHKINEIDLAQSSATLLHRGGNGNGLIFDQKDHYTLGIAHQRLATVDLSKKASQPFTSNCGKYSITLDGTIFNYLELREALIKYGVIFSTLSDTEVILEGYKKWGYSCFEMLDGSFAFAIIDRKLNQLLIAKDEIGGKPIYYYKEKGFYAFASEIRALISYPSIKKEINKNAIPTFFRYGYFIGEETIYNNIYKLKKGTLTTIDIHSGNGYDTPLTRKQLIPSISESNHTEEQILDHVEDLLTESILKRNVADVSIGVLLSGGFDSAIVAAILQKNQTKRIKTYTVSYKNEKLDEALQARKVAEHLKTNHKEFYLDKVDAINMANNLPEVFDEPIGDSSAILLLFIANKVKDEVKVLLGSEGGDELFGGYRTYAKAIKINSLLSGNLPKLLKDALIKFLMKTQPKLKEVLEGEGLLNKYLAINACYSLNQIGKLLNVDADIPNKAKGNAQNIKDLLIHDLHNYLPNNIFLKNDKCFSHYGVDNRDALLKNELIVYLASLDSKWFIKEGEQKYLLKKITAKYIPSSFIANPKKGFVIPLAKWLKTILKPLVEEYLSEEKLKQHQLFNVKEALKIKSSFYANCTNYNAQRVWLLLQFQMWYYKWMV
ncbi:asparagine synthase (glutamine-hydrolyzing) [Pedobacter frigiditerrae]|uniref:asparagine synthase (glutamine-hydrolyzing) n=1 Tax=Pedobacter frigiditerrae TaxID=2530452 RepID=UPI00292DB5D2|nr:asparagine synthase (glutamine-hydrolyzing) [Pedobacter frigiditerrae]